MGNTVDILFEEVALVDEAEKFAAFKNKIAVIIG